MARADLHFVDKEGAILDGDSLNSLTCHSLGLRQSGVYL